MRKVIDEAQNQRIINSQLIKKQMSKKFNYSLDDFSIELSNGNWKHKDWKTWMKGCGQYDQTQRLVEKYIAECKKPYGQRNLSQFHLA